jgi:hypothetical protein
MMRKGAGVTAGSFVLKYHEASYRRRDFFAALRPFFADFFADLFADFFAPFRPLLAAIVVLL